jgi:lanosterol synthase
MRPTSTILDGLNVILAQCSLSPCRRAAIKRVYDIILTEDDNTDYQDSGLMDKMMNFIVRWYVDGTESAPFKKHRWRRADLGRSGMMMTGTGVGCGISFSSPKLLSSLDLLQ